MKRLVWIALLAAGNAAAFGIGEPPSVIAQKLGANAAELAACGVGSADLRKYAAKAEAQIGKQSKKADEAAVNVAVMKSSYHEQLGRFNAGLDKVDCDTVVSRAAIR